ncbi:hypothetical protein E4U21_004215, partial [Claviceps maximensis]
APTVPGAPPRVNPNEGDDYAAFLKLLRSKLDKGKTISVAAPASYWHLMQFPIKEISETVDYIVYMTNNLHKQWDSTNKWKDPSCSFEACVANPINIDDTFTALTMITRAGVPSSKIVVALTSYGRSFKLEDPTCHSPNCPTKGSLDEASSKSTKGLCTNMEGHIGNAEILAYANISSSRVWYDKNSDTQMLLYSDNSWVAFMTPQIKVSRMRKFKSLNLGGAGDFAIDLDAFHPPPYGMQVNWETVKHNIMWGDKPDACDWEFRTGTWVNHSCTEDQVVAPFNYTSRERWVALDSDSAWNDAKARWLFCDSKRIQFTQSVTQFFHANENAKCNDLAQVDSCDPIATCEEHNSVRDAKKSYSGPAAYLVWNSLATVHAMLKNYASTLRDAALQIERQKQEFVDTFAPKGTVEDTAQILAIMLTLANVPIGVMGTQFFKQVVLQLKYFKANPITGEVVRDITMQLASAGTSIAARFLPHETVKEITFNALYDVTIKKWGDEIDSLVVSLFNGSAESISRLENLIKNGIMVPGAPEIQRRGMDQEHTNKFLQERMAERVFYSAAIPHVWRMRQPWGEYPMILDFGPNCNRDIGAGSGWFAPDEDYNDGFVCYKDHAYILAAAFDRKAYQIRCDHIAQKILRQNKGFSGHHQE